MSVVEKIKQKSFMAGTGRIILVKDVLRILTDHEQKLRELADLLKNRPKEKFPSQFLKGETHYHDTEVWFEVFEKKFGVESVKDTKKESVR